MTRSRSFAAIANVVGALLLLVSLFVPWFVHDATTGEVHTVQSYGLLSRQDCSNFGQPSLVCHNEFLVRHAIHALYPAWVDAGLVTFVLSSSSALVLFAAAWAGARGASRAGRFRPDGIALRVTLLAVVAGCVFVVRHPADMRVRELAIAPGVVWLVAGAVVGVAGLLLRAAAPDERSPAAPVPDWIAAGLAFAACGVILASVLTTAWRADAEAHSFGTVAAVHCDSVVRALRCIRDEYSPVERVRSQLATFKQYGRWTFNAGLGATTVLLLALASAVAARTERERRVLAIAATGACVVLLAYATRFITADAGLPGAGLGIGYPLAVAGSALGIASTLRLLWSSKPSA